MAEPKSHHRLESRITLTGILVTETALHVGSGAGDSAAAGTDLPVARNGRGEPYIPGSSFRGAYRSALEALLRGLGTHRVCDPFANEGDEKSCSERTKERRQALEQAGQEVSEARAFELAWEESCAVCRLFGQLFLASRVRVADLRLADPRLETYVRDGVGIDRDLRSAAGGILYNFEAVPPGARFDLRLEVENADDAEMGLLLTGLELLDEGLFTIGGKGARGLGAARVEDLSVVRRTAADFFTGSGTAALGDDRLSAFRDQARAAYVEGSD